MKRRISGIFISMVMALAISAPVYAGSWRSNASGWWWQEDNGSYPVNEWKWLDGNNDGVAECYHFNSAGYLDTATVTADGSAVNADGAWIVNGVVQTKMVGAQQQPGGSGNAGTGDKAGYVYVPGLGYVPQTGYADSNTSGVAGTPEGKENGNKIGYMN